MNRIRLFLTCMFGILLGGCETLDPLTAAFDPEPAAASEKPAPATPAEPSTREHSTGKVSWYSVKTNGGTRTASGIPFADHHDTAAHRSLPFGTKIKVTNLGNGQSTLLTVTDRGPYHGGRILDVSIGAAKKLGFVSQGVATCRIDLVDHEPEPKPAPEATVENSEPDRGERVADAADGQSQGRMLLLPLQELFTQRRPAS